MSTYQKVIICGNLGQDPDVRYTQSNTAVANLSVATTEKWKDKQGNQQEETEWHRVVLWGRTAEVAQEYLKKGSKVLVEGVLQTRKWEDKEGVERYTTEIKGLSMTMLSSSGGGGGFDKGPHPADRDKGSAGGNAYSEPQNKGNQKVDSSTDLNEDFSDIDDDLPF